MAFPGSKSRCSISVHCPFYVTATSQGSHRKMPPPEMPSEFLLKALTVCSLQYSCLSFPAVSSPYLQNLPILPLTAISSLSIHLQPTLHLPHFICWLTHSLAPLPVSLYLALPVHLKLFLFWSVCLSPLQGKPPLLLPPPLDNENGAHFLSLL